ncbi:tetratricopeptide repeat-containing protein [Sphingomonas sp. AR_OL41]|uniref:ATP-grasp domain-containing protein n=1 Tax=Sphingomonas sp. AR_OL41 TaxID=3042729 RepID=UPI002481831C|nr:tetratricopeptide repeat-containing protein [Sphingomonas sp. AR_OL41]MDH7974728.1 tetratricopeptide repeat-containing protein [Sphingomonas sp. AR_OL41]
MIPEVMAASLPATLGPARLGRSVENRLDLSALIDTLIERVSGETADAGALLDLSFLSQFTGNRDGGLELQAQAVAAQRVYANVYGDGSDNRVLALLAPGDLTTNTPLDFLVEHSNITLLTVYLDPDADAPADIALPDHDVAILAIGESPANAALLRRLAGPCARWPRPMINAGALHIASMTRDTVAASFAGEATILAPETRRIARAQLDRARLDFPITIRPTGTQAGAGLERIEDPAGLANYVARYPDPEFYVADFIDYSAADGLFRKQRIVFIDRVPYISHLAVSEHWIVHYMSAGMTENARRRTEEAAFMARFDADFCRRHARAFEILCDRIGLDYFGIDCGETPDGRLLLFEVDVAMIVHAIEDGAEFSYKKAPMARLFDAFGALLRDRAARAVGPPSSASLN